MLTIHIEYEPTAQELANASILLIEKKPLMLITMGLINLLTGVLLFIMVLKLCLLGLNLNEGLVTFTLAAWLFGRRPFSRWLLHYRMKRVRALNKPIAVEISPNGITWQGKGIIPGSLAWEQVKYLLEAKNGFILPQALNRFLWLPFRGFPSPTAIESFKRLIKEKRITHRLYQKWQC